MTTDASAHVGDLEPDAEIPAGYERFVEIGGFGNLIGPLYWMLGDEGFSIGCRVAARHCNALGRCHGGMLASLLDQQLPLGARANEPRLTDNFLLTVSLQVDYLDGAPLGAWITGTTQVLKVTRRLVFAQGLICFNGVPLVRGSTVLKIGGDARGSSLDIGAMLRQG